MDIGVFLLIEPFASVEQQLQRAKEMGFRCADITDTNSGGSMLGTAGFSPTVSLDGNPFEIKRLFEKYEIVPSTVCAHAALLEPSSPGTYGTAEIMKAIRFAAAIGIRDVITSEMEAKSPWARSLSRSEQILVTAEKLTEPIKLATDCGVRLLLEPHGPVTDSTENLQAVFDRLGDPPSLGVNLDTGNSWLGGADPVEMATVFRDRIHHVHWKDLGAEWEEKRGEMYGCGFSTIALGEGVIDIRGVCDALKEADIASSTLEIVGDDEVLSSSVDYLRACGI